MITVTCLGPVQPYQTKTREGHGRNHRLPPLPLGKRSVPQVEVPVKAWSSYIRNLTITHITDEELKGMLVAG